MRSKKVENKFVRDETITIIAGNYFLTFGNIDILAKSFRYRTLYIWKLLIHKTTVSLLSFQ